MRRGTKIALGIVTPVVAAGTVLGVLFGLRIVDIPGGGEETFGGDDAVRSIISASPSDMPSVAVTEPPVTESPVVQCPIGQKEFILRYSNRGNNDSDVKRRRDRWLEETQQQQERQDPQTDFLTWYVKDMCTGERIVSCKPCPSLISEASASLPPVAFDTTSLSPTAGLSSSPSSSPSASLTTGLPSSSPVDVDISSSSPSSSLTVGSPSSSPSVASDTTPSLPSSSPVAASLFDTSIFHSKNNDRHLRNKQFVTRNMQQKLQERSRECIPSDLSYAFVVESIENPNECCSFHNAEEYVATYDGKAIAFAGPNGSSSGSTSLEQIILFGEAARTCPTDSPSEMLPSAVPSIEPSVTISNNSSAVSSEVPSISPSGTRIQSVSPSINPSISSSTINPTLNSTATSSTNSTATSSTNSTATSSTNFTLSPTKAPTAEQKPVPSLRPTCKIDRSFNLCIAVDMSGSICSNNDGDCIGCGTCRDELVTQGTCCTNFAFVKGFASLMIRSLSTFPADKTFSIVQFATKGQLISLMETNTEATSTIDELYYTGGITNHAEAISECRRSLSAAQSFQKTSSMNTIPHQNFMVLITDGKPTTPDDDPLGAALSEARKAREENGLFIIPVFISPKYDGDALSFMRGLSSNDRVFDVVDYESLNTLKDQLLKEVSCSLHKKTSERTK